jgi:RNA recognition motif-containing protein
MQCGGGNELAPVRLMPSPSASTSGGYHVMTPPTNGVGAVEDPLTFVSVRRRRVRKHHRRKSSVSHPTDNSLVLPPVSAARDCQPQVHHQHRKVQTQPPPSAKLFVGQLPINVSDGQLRSLFAEFGRIVKLKIHRDRFTGECQRCCFVTYATAKSAKNARDTLHNNRRLPGMLNPLQVKLADSNANNSRLRKLFIGMISKDLSEKDLMEMFVRFGDIDECSIVREPGVGSKGCAFLTFADKQAAAAAITSMHRSHVQQGCTAPIVVRLADSRETKLLKRLRTQLYLHQSRESRCPADRTQRSDERTVYCGRTPPSFSPAIVRPHGVHRLTQHQAATSVDQAWPTTFVPAAVIATLPPSMSQQQQCLVGLDIMEPHQLVTHYTPLAVAPTAVTYRQLVQWAA